MAGPSGKVGPVFFIGMLMLPVLENAVAQYIAANGLVPGSSGILLAVSGGADSMAMMHCLHSLRSQGVIKYDLFVGHVNHQLRGAASDGDEVFVLDEARRLGLQAASLRVDVRADAASLKLSIETAARNLRRQALADIAKTFGCTTVATAHHKDDNAETLIHRLLRGTGYRGLAGIWPKKEFLADLMCIRPLLAVSRQQIHEYLKERGLSWRQDASNENLDHTRNFIRHRLLPYMSKQAADSLVDELASLAQACKRYYTSIAAEADTALQSAIRSRGPGGIELDRNIFNRCPPAVKVELIQRCLEDIRCGQQAVTAAHYQVLFKMAEEQAGGKKLTLPGGAVAKCYRDAISFSIAADSPPEILPQCPLKVPGITAFGPWQIATRLLNATEADFVAFKRDKIRFVEWFDADAICGPLQVRSRQKGDRFTPLGSAPQQKVGKFLTAARASDDIRSSLAIIADDEKIIWLAPLRPSEEAKITAHTTTILEIVFEAPNTRVR
jgi:tRNA(Ile)-lysidine synthase